MNKAVLSEQFENKKPSAIRLAQIEFMKRTDGVEAVNVAIGNVSLPMHPAMIERMKGLGTAGSPFENGVVAYTPTVGTVEANRAVLRVIGASGFNTEGLYSQITDGGSSAMELVILGVCGAAAPKVSAKHLGGQAGRGERPLLVFEPAYTNYMEFALRLGRRVVSVRRELSHEGKFELPERRVMEEVIEREKPGAMLVIPYDNPSGTYVNSEEMRMMAELCVKYNMWLVSDEAYRELGYELGIKNQESSNKRSTLISSVWGVNEEDVPGIVGRRISIESASKVWNACGLRIGAVVTDNKQFHEKSVAEYTTNLCANALGQYIYGALAEEENLEGWFEQQRGYYRGLMAEVAEGIAWEMPGTKVSSPDAAIYLVVDVAGMVDEKFEMSEFGLWCAREGKVDVQGKQMTLLVAPMRGFYGGEGEPGRTQMRIACVESVERMRLVPRLLAELLREYCL